MSHFRVGDIVKRIHNLNVHYGPFCNGKPFKITEPPINGFVKDPDGRVHVASQLRLEQPGYGNEGEAVKLLLELGYKVEEPPKPMTGEIVVVRNKEGAMRVWDTATWNDFLSRYKAGWDILAKVKWTEGEGI
jgi:hypothetical protein